MNTFTRILGAASVAAAALAGPSGVQAQPAAAPASPAKPVAVTPEQIAQGRRLLRAMNLEAGVTRTLDMLIGQTREQTISQVKDLPVEKQRPVMDAFASAVEAPRTRLTQGVLDDLAAYYATQLSTAEINDLSTFYETPLGQKAVLTPDAMTPQENEQLGAYALEHPQFMRVLQLAPGTMETTRTSLQRRGPVFRAAFTRSYCANLGKIGMTNTSCPKPAAKKK
ncbi:hypothetical protein DMC18_07630 [Caulobacter sp. D5]|uniref:DUF2059 domain-containing protein n=2 Tax=unclassified Caulobacter TaxID=2648921 RepID=UPI000D73879A|nr:DUF2059 domain-containing protein [Caulobacter sp. D5]PXA93953.1 hypothetical protein DMC18_07630 [Caulobacter sp. D5]